MPGRPDPRAPAADARAWMHRHRRRLRIAGAVALAVWLLYLIAANVFLNTAIGERVINQRPERFNAEWRWAVSVWPGFIHVREVRMGGRTRATAWEASASRAAGRIQVLPLLRKEVRIASTWGENVSLITDRSRRLDDDEADALEAGRPGAGADDGQAGPGADRDAERARDEDGGDGTDRSPGTAASAGAGRPQPGQDLIALVAERQAAGDDDGRAQDAQPGRAAPATAGDDDAAAAAGGNADADTDDRHDRREAEGSDEASRSRGDDGQDRPRTRSPWSLRMDRIHTGTLALLQFDDWRFEGGGSAEFGFSKTFAGGTLEIFPSRLDMPLAHVRHGDLDVFENGRIQFTLALPPHLPREVRGRHKVGITDARLQVGGEVPGLQLVEHADGRIDWQPGATPGRLDVDLAVVRGELQPDGHVRLQTRIETVGDAAAPDRLPLRLDVDVEENGVHARARLPQTSGHPAFLDADLRTAHRHLDGDEARRWLDTLTGRVAFAWRFGSLRWINPLLPAQGWLRLEGEADVTADLTVEAGELAPGSTAAIREARLFADVFDSVFSGEAHVEARVDQDGDVRRTHARIVAERFEVAAQDDPDASYVQGRDLRLDLEAEGALAEFRDTLQAHLLFSDARIPDLRVYNRYLPGDSLRLLGGSGTLGGDLRIDPQGEVVEGDLQLSGQGAGIRVGVSELQGDLSVNGAIRRVRGGQRDYLVEPLQLQLRDVRLAGANDAPWWAHMDLGGARLTWREPFVVDSDVRLRMKDASLLLSLFAERTAFPRWIGRIVDSGEVDATARTRVEGETFIVDGLQASNDRVDLHARLKVAGGQPRGDLYARWGVLGVGAELRDNERDLHLIGARDWYESRPPLLSPR
ncbi:hypothetical protein [Luteimonas abyssi]|uniref:hypothetical protein n=1 Tax=Luteimonas abyssi TaxID=1247514 RepID=UPI000737C470|nr:hypothetical protein [Luteimonas abyssi]